MIGSRFQFDARQQHQLDAIQSVVDLFDGQPHDVQALLTNLGSPGSQHKGQLPIELENSAEIGAIGNNLVLDEQLIVSNLQRVQDRNGLEVVAELQGGSLDFDIEMETGTGKTYVYLRTVFELAKNYNFTKFIILVPSVAIREGVSTSIRLMREHFHELYPALPFDAAVYRGEAPEEVQSFATSTNVQILIMTIASIRGDKNNRVIHQVRDKLNGLRPIDYLKACCPIVIMDEPQNMESELSGSAIEELDPLCRLRYSATHRKQRNVVYRLDPVDAHELGLVKQIVVADVHQAGADASPYIKLIEVKQSPWVARLELACRKADGSLARKVISVRQHQELSDLKLSGNPVYEGWRVAEMSMWPMSVELTKHGILLQGESIGGSNQQVYKEMIRQTVKEHLRKDLMLRHKGIKVLSLFFVDKVAHFLGNGSSNVDADGDFVRWFDEVYLEERQKSARYQELLPYSPSEVRRAYFSELKAKGRTTLQDSTGSSKEDDDAYRLIMRDKEQLLDEAEPVRFIFSHSALREGWDNPNVFQICTLREIGADGERRQTLGRGLRLPVSKTSDGFVRVPDSEVATLTVVANESFQAFAQNLQTEYAKAGVDIGVVRKSEFSKITLLDQSGVATDEELGYQRSLEIWRHLESSGFIKDGQVTPQFQPHTVGFSLNLPVGLQPYESEIVDLVSRSNLGRFIKPANKLCTRRLNKEFYATPEFAEFWRAIAKKTTYRVSFDRLALIEHAVKAIQESPSIEPLQIVATYAKVKVLRGGAKSEAERNATPEALTGAYELPDIIAELQASTSLTRTTLVDILVQSGRLTDFLSNPNDFIALVKKALKDVLAQLVVDGVQYEQSDGFVYELRELQADGLDARDHFIDQLYKVRNQEKTDSDFVILDGGPGSPERQFAEYLDLRDDIKLFVKLPPKFKVPTPVGPYNPDWAIIKQEAGKDKIYLVRETKSTLDDRKLRPYEVAKMKSAKKHFEAIGIEDYGRSVPARWNI